MSDKIIVRSAMKDKKNFTELPELRRGIIDVAPTTPLMANYTVNAIANALHPSVQHLKIKQYEELDKNIVILCLSPDTAAGTAKLAPFRPGQKIDFHLDDSDKTRVATHTICSSPARALKDEYVIIINRSTDTDLINYIADKKSNNSLNASAPYGDFYYQAIRDCNRILAICDSSAYEPILSMAESVCDGTLNIDLTVIYTARKHNEVAMADRFLELSQNKHMKFVAVLSDEHIFKCERGFITKSLLEKYAPSDKYSLFFSGSDELLKTISPYIDELKPESNRVRYNR